MVLPKGDRGQQRMGLPRVWVHLKGLLPHLSGLGVILFPQVGPAQRANRQKVIGLDASCLLPEYLRVGGVPLLLGEHTEHIKDDRMVRSFAVNKFERLLGYG